MRRIALLAAAGFLCAGCFHVTVVTGAPTSPQIIDRPWQNSFVIGLVPPPDVATRDSCPRGVAVVETERSFLNGLVGAITQSIYTPMHVKVTCASGPVAR
jgi:hypothetical protein